MTREHNSAAKRRLAAIRQVEQPAASPPAAAPLALSVEPGQPPPSVATIPLLEETEMIAILERSIGFGESALAGYGRKEAALRAVFARLDATNAKAIHERLANPIATDVLAAAFGRLAAERRARLLDCLVEPRREWLLKAEDARVRMVP
jgi:hypothetical protein